MAIDLLALFELDFYKQVLGVGSIPCALHAAAVAFPRGAIILAGESGAGKSTLALCLVEAGGLYLTDECAALMPGGQVLGLTRPISFDSLGDTRHVKKAAQPVPYLYRGNDGTLCEHYLLSIPGPHTSTKKHTIRCIIALNRGADCAGTSIRLSPAAALSRLWPHLCYAQAEALLMMGELVRTSPVFELFTGPVSDTRAALNELLACAMAT